MRANGFDGIHSGQGTQRQPRLPRDNGTRRRDEVLTLENVRNLGRNQAQLNQARRGIFDIDDLILHTGKRDFGYPVYGHKIALQILGIFMQFRQRISVTNDGKIEGEHIAKVIVDYRRQSIWRQPALRIIHLCPHLRKPLIQRVIIFGRPNGELNRYIAQTGRRNGAHFVHALQLLQRVFDHFGNFLRDLFGAGTGIGRDDLRLTDNEFRIFKTRQGGIGKISGDQDQYRRDG